MDYSPQAVRWNTLLGVDEDWKFVSQSLLPYFCSNGFTFSITAFAFI